MGWTLRTPSMKQIALATTSGAGVGQEFPAYPHLPHPDMVTYKQGASLCDTGR